MNGTPGVVQCTTPTAVPGRPVLCVSSDPLSLCQPLIQRPEQEGDPERQIRYPAHSPCVTLGSDFPLKYAVYSPEKMGPY